MSVTTQIREIEKKISGKILFNENLSKYSWFNLGGTAKIVFKPKNLMDLSFFLKNTKGFNQIKVLGAGSNTLIRDGGFDGLIIKLGKSFSHLSLFSEDTIIAGASALDKNVSNFALDSSITGLSTTEVVQTMFIQNGIAVPVITHTTLIITTPAGTDEYEFLEFMQSYAVEVGVVEPDLFAMYPNPSTDNVTIKWINKADAIEIYDGAGRLVESVSHCPGLNVTGIDVRDLNPGVYTVSLTSGKHVTTKKLVVE